MRKHFFTAHILIFCQITGLFPKKASSTETFLEIVQKVGKKIRINASKKYTTNQFLRLMYTDTMDPETPKFFDIKSEVFVLLVWGKVNQVKGRSGRILWDPKSGKC